MAATIAIDNTDGRFVEGARFVTKGTINLGIYATNGVAVTAAQFELPSTIADLNVRATKGVAFEWDRTNSKVKAFRQKDPAAAGGADIALVEVTNGTDLSTFLSRFQAKGY